MPSIDQTGIRAPARGACARRAAALAAALLLGGAATALAQDVDPLPPVPVPAENPITEQKRVLGKILFWDEQLSSDDTMSCGTCHIPSSGGADPRITRMPGPDGALQTADDVFASPGVVRQDAADAYTPDPVFGTGVQVTGRQAPSVLLAAYAPSLFWDGRAESRFVDPQTEATAIQSGGALESQAVGPPVSDVEMAHMARDWDAIAAKLAAAPPLALASDLPADVAEALRSAPTYPDLFRDAFGSEAIDARRVAMAIATYQRTLIPDQTPADRFVAGDLFALTAAESRGFTAFQFSGCAECHADALLTDNSFRNIGLRPVSEDRGRQDATGRAQDRGKFKVPSLRNVALRPRFMHTGQFTSLTDVLRFYARAPGTQQFTDNQDPVMRLLFIPPPVAADIEAFLRGGLTDPRAANEEFPFDRPTLFSERRPRNPELLARATPGQGGVSPVMLALVPPRVGSDVFKLGVARARGGAEASLLVATAPPVGGVLTPDEVLGPVTLSGGAAGEGVGTLPFPLTDEALEPGQELYFQWRIADPDAAGGEALSPVAKATLIRTAQDSDPLPDPDPGPQPDPLPLVDDGMLYVQRAAFTVNHARHAAGRAADSLVLVCALNPATLPTDPEGLAVRVDVAGTTVVAGATLDARGRERSRGGGLDRRIAFDSRRGTLVLRIRRADLRGVFAVADEAGGGTLTVPVSVTVSDDVGAPASASTQTAFVYSARAGRAGAVARGRHSMSVAPPEGGVFAVTALRARPRADGYVVSFSAVVSAPQDVPLEPTGPVVIEIGDAAPLSITAGSIRSTASGLVYRPALAPLGAVSRLTYSQRSHRLQVTTTALEGVGLDSFAAFEAALPVRVSVPTDDGLARFETEVRVLRTPIRSSRWSR